MSAGGQSRGCDYSRSVSGTCGISLGSGALLCPCVVHSISLGKPVCCFESNSWKHLMEEETKTQGFNSSTGIATSALIQAHPVPSAGEPMDVGNLDRSRSLLPASVTLDESTNLSKSQFSCPGSRANVSCIGLVGAWHMVLATGAVP